MEEPVDKADRPAITKKRKGFACISPERRKEIASMGGKAVPAERRSFSQSKELASEAGRRGGIKSGASRKVWWDTDDNV